MDADMRLAAIREYFNPVEFVIDEQPLEVSMPEIGSRLEGTEDSDNPLDTVMTSGDAQPPGDLQSQISALLVEQTRLLERARALEKEPGNADEFGRFVRQLLPFLDNFDHLLEMGRKHPASEEIDNWLKSVEALYFRIVNLLESFGLRFISSVGKPVNLDYQEVVDYRPTSMHRHNTVIKELQKAIVYRDRLIRDAKVVVACNEEDGEA